MKTPPCEAGSAVPVAKRARQNFTTDIMVSRYQDIILRMLEKKGISTAAVD